MEIATRASTVTGPVVILELCPGDTVLILCISGAAVLAALALCDHSTAAAVPPRGQMHRVVVILSGVPSIGPGGMPQATGDAAAALVLTEVLVALCIFSVLHCFLHYDTRCRRQLNCEILQPELGH